MLFNLTAIIGSAILYRDFDKINFHRFLTFFYGCLTTFLGTILPPRSYRSNLDMHRCISPHPPLHSSALDHTHTYIDPSPITHPHSNYTPPSKINSSAHPHLFGRCQTPCRRSPRLECQLKCCRTQPGAVLVIGHSGRKPRYGCCPGKGRHRTREKRTKPEPKHRTGWYTVIFNKQRPKINYVCGNHELLTSRELFIYRVDITL